MERNSSSSSVALALAVGAGMAIFGIGAQVSASGMPRHNVAADRGYRVAARECSACHAISREGESPRPSAPPFRDIRRRYNEISLSREFEAIGEVGHYEMPAKPISKSDGEDLIAYIESLAR
jgi:mono/diheme cytochrome c family protein